MTKPGGHGKYILAQQCVTILIHFAQVMILSQLLTSADYGVANMAASMFALAVVFRDGLSTTTLQARDLKHSDLSNLFWVSQGVSVVVALVLLACSPICALWFENRFVIPLMFGHAVAFLLGSLGSQPLALAQRDFRFRELAIWRVSAILTAFATAVVLASMGAGAWAIIAYAIMLECVTMVGSFMISRFRPGGIGRLRETKKYFQFGGTLTVSGFVSYLGRNADKILIGRYLGADALGYYSRAQNLMLMPMQKVLAGFKRFNIAALSEAAEDLPRFQQAIGRVQRMYLLPCSLFIVPVAAYSNDVVAFLMGDQWAPVAPVLLVLSPFIWVHITQLICFVAHIAKGDARGLLGYYVINTAILTTAVAATVRMGLTSVSIAYCLAGVLGVQFVLLAFCARRKFIDLASYLADYLSNAIVCGAIFAALRIFQTKVYSADLSWVNLCLGFSISTLAFFACYVAIPNYRSTLEDLRSEALGVFQKVFRQQPSES